MYFFNTLKETLREMKFYRWREGRPVEGDREKTEGDDHAMDAMRYICMERPSPFMASRSVIPGTFDYFRQLNTQRRIRNGAYL